MSKYHLRSFFSDNGLRVRNEQKDPTQLGLVAWQRKGSSDKARLNDLKAKDVR